MNPSEKHTLEIDSVELSFGDRRILSGVYLAVETGGVSAILGRNGCGKSCLMKILCGSLRAGFRSMRIDGVWHDRFRADEVRYLPQQGFIPGWLTLDRVLRDYDMTRGDLLKWFPLFEKLFGTKIYAMSGGELVTLVFEVDQGPVLAVALQDDTAALAAVAAVGAAESHEFLAAEMRRAGSAVTRTGEYLYVIYKIRSCHNVPYWVRRQCKPGAKPNSLGDAGAHPV